MPSLHASTRTVNGSSVSGQHRSHAFVVGLALTALLGCGGDSSPSSPSPQPANVAGVWAYQATLASINGGECVGSSLPIGATDRGTIQITQAGSSLTAVLTSTDDGTSCSYAGTAGASTVALNITACAVGGFRVSCTNGAVRNVQISTGALTLNVAAAGTASGTQVETYNITTTAGAPVGVLTLNATMNAQRR